MFDALTSCGIKGEALFNAIVLHGVIGTIKKCLFKNLHSEASVAVRTGHHDFRFVSAYQTLRSIPRVQHQNHTLGCGESTSQGLFDSCSVNCIIVGSEVDSNIKKPTIDASNIPTGAVDMRSIGVISGRITVNMKHSISNGSLSGLPSVQSWYHDLRFQNIHTIFLDGDAEIIALREQYMMWFVPALQLNSYHGL